MLYNYTISWSKLCLVIKIYLSQKNDILRDIILQIETYCHRFEIHRVITMYFTVRKPCILQNTKDLGKGSNSTLYSKVYRLEFLIKFICINIGETYRDLKGSFSILQIYKDSQFNNTKTKILKCKCKTRLKPWGNLLRFSARPEDVEKT